MTFPKLPFQQIDRRPHLLSQRSRVPRKLLQVILFAVAGFQIVGSGMQKRHTRHVKRTSYAANRLRVRLPEYPYVICYLFPVHSHCFEYQ